MTPNERLSKAIMAIKFQGKARTQSEIAAKLGYQVSYLSDLINKRFEISEKFARRLSDVFGINREWLLRGEGEILNSDVQPFESSDILYRSKPAGQGMVSESYATYKTGNNPVVDQLIEENKMLVQLNEKLLAMNEKLSETNQQLLDKVLKDSGGK